MSPPSISALALAYCSGSSFVRKRMRTLVSMARTTFGFPRNCLIHIFDGLGLALVSKHSCNLRDAGSLEKWGASEENSIVRVLNHKLGAAVPMSAVTNGLRQNNLALGRHDRGELLCRRHYEF